MSEKVDLAEERLFPIGPWGLISRWVCAPKSWSPERVGQEATRNDPPGTSGGWVVSGNDADTPEHPQPCPDCDDRQHWIINC